MMSVRNERAFSRRTTRENRRHRPAVEGMEHRRLLAAGVTVVTSGFSTTVNVVGSEGNDEITVVRPAGGIGLVAFTVRDRNTGAVLAQRNVLNLSIDRVSVDARGGDDIVTSNFNLPPVLSGSSTILRGGSGNDTLRGTAGPDALYGDGGADNLQGNGGDDWLLGGADDDNLGGGGGSDNVYGQSGDDTLGGGDQDDYLDGGLDDDDIYGGLGHDTLHGGDGHDDLSGEDGRDELYGEAGYDTLEGGLDFWDDLLSGGADPDIFVVYTVTILGLPPSSYDHNEIVVDFVHGFDTIRREIKYA